MSRIEILSRFSRKAFDRLRSRVHDPNVKVDKNSRITQKSLVLFKNFDFVFKYFQFIKRRLPKKSG